MKKIFSLFLIFTLILPVQSLFAESQTTPMDEMIGQYTKFLDSALNKNKKAQKIKEMKEIEDQIEIMAQYPVGKTLKTTKELQDFVTRSSLVPNKPNMTVTIRLLGKDDRDAVKTNISGLSRDAKFYNPLNYVIKYEAKAETSFKGFFTGEVSYSMNLIAEQVGKSDASKTGRPTTTDNVSNGYVFKNNNGDLKIFITFALQEGVKVTTKFLNKDGSYSVKEGQNAASCLSSNSTCGTAKTNQFEVQYVKNAKDVLIEVVLTELALNSTTKSIPELSSGLVNHWFVQGDKPTSSDPVLSVSKVNDFGDIKASAYSNPSSPNVSSDTLYFYKGEGKIDINGNVSIKFTFSDKPTMMNYFKNTYPDVPSEGIKKIVDQLFYRSDFYIEYSFKYVPHTKMMEGKRKGWGTINYDLKTFKVNKIKEDKEPRKVKLVLKTK